MEAHSGTERLTDQEVEALCSAAAWYAKYHARIIAERADDPSAYALAQRERYRHLLAGLRKLGVKLRDPIGELRQEPADDRIDRKAV